MYFILWGYNNMWTVVLLESLDVEKDFGTVAT